VFKLMKTGLVVEYEVKISRSDFFNDFKKSHKRWKQDEVFKHQELAAGRASNRFVFVVPLQLIRPDEVPDYAGLMYYAESINKIATIKPAPLIHRDEFQDYKSLATSLSWREDRWRRKFYKV
jgi:hypothetical protein